MGRRPVAAGRSVSTKPSAIKLKARITKYNDCQQPMANGKMPQPGYVAVSDRRIKLGSLIWIGYQRYIVGDYTSKWVHKKSVREGYDLTVDIFTREKRQDCLEFGVKKEHIALQKA